MALVDIPFNPNNFHNNPITNPYMPLAPGNTWVYQTIPTDPTEPTAIDTVTVTNQTKVIDGVKCVVVSDIAKIGNKAEEATKDYFAQDDAGNVWYFGEDTKVPQPGGVDRTGTWRAGVVPQGGTEPAGPGIIMLADPKNNLNNNYFEENALPVAHDGATVTDINATAEIVGGTTLTGLLQTTNTDIDGTTETKFYSAGVGFVRGQASDGTDVLQSFTQSGGASLVQAMAGFGNQSAVHTSSPSKPEHAQLADIVASHHAHHA